MPKNKGYSMDHGMKSQGHSSEKIMKDNYGSGYKSEMPKTMKRMKGKKK